jgi:trans-aconitate 2-methyltransferase
MINHFNQVLFLLFISFINMACLAREDGWDPILYRQNSSMQKRWAIAALRNINLKPADTILDIGSGDGSITSHIAKHHPQAKVMGLDLSPKMVSFAKDTYLSQSNLSFTLGDAQKLTFENEFDAVTSFSTLHRLQEPKAAI